MERWWLLAVLLAGAGAQEEGAREGRKLVLKKVRRKQPEPLGQCPEVSHQTDLALGARQ